MVILKIEQIFRYLEIYLPLPYLKRANQEKNNFLYLKTRIAKGPHGITLM